ncbi:MAG: hypothetical protein QF599_10680 [Planctomycetota bacterium]|jgi:hypothetical protein|nr:hypothetical protein [Planctomycetota bacterium]MDP6518924.1 hypothetical protein [Planctomycetota bacterium]MDP6956429.1 hypothetical protein [Planctomycetota bacterium]
MGVVRPALLLIPRPDLSETGVDVLEFRIKGHDEVPLYGLAGRSTFHRTGYAARVRLSGPAAELCVDQELIATGTADVVLQSPAGRRLEDRVLDLLRIREVARDMDGVADIQIRQSASPVPEDDLLIARQLISAGLA